MGLGRHGGEADRAIRGLVIGKFMPVHNGHRYLIDTALAQVARLTIVVCSSPGELIPGPLRFQWMQALYPQVHVVHLVQEASWSPRGHPACYGRWAQALQRGHPAPIDLVFGSEEYIAPLA